MKPINKLILVLAATAAFAGPVLPLAAQETANAIVVTGDIKAVKTFTGPDGKADTKLVEPDTIVPGDRLVFINDYAHKGTEAVTNFVVTNKLPAEVRLSPDADKALTVSVDGGKTWGVLAALTVSNPDGTTRPATQADVTHVHWVLASVAPGASGRLAFPTIIR